MSCLTPNYNPVPTHIGSRVQNRCVYDIEYNYTNESFVYVPQLKISVPILSIQNVNNMLKKGNILQYKCNSSNLTKKQKYSKIVNGNWTNRSKTWATQNQKFTNPNNNYLKRINVPTNITLSGYPTNLPITCTNNPENLNPDVTIIQDGGTLLCNSLENPCNGFNKVFPSSSLCQPTSASDVPGQLTYLCYNTSQQTYYPRQNYTMNNSLNKWPVNAKDLCRSGNSLQPYNCNKSIF